MSWIEWNAIPYTILPIIQPETRMVNAIGTLCSHSFVTKRDDEQKDDMHRLVHLATRIWVDRSGRRAETRKKTIQHPLAIFPSDDYANREIWREYLPHVARICKDDPSEDAKERTELCFKVGRCLLLDGRIREAVRWLEVS